MQFWKIHKHPIKNAELLPDMVLMTNIREGWQQLSDIGHMHGITWEGQNKLYSLRHPCTRSHCINLQVFKKFILSYAWCLDEARRRGLNIKTWEEKMKLFYNAYEMLLHFIPVNRTEEQFQAEYLLTKKYNTAGKQQISDEEIERIRGLL